MDHVKQHDAHHNTKKKRCCVDNHESGQRKRRKLNETDDKINEDDMYIHGLFVNNRLLMKENHRIKQERDQYEKEMNHYKKQMEHFKPYKEKYINLKQRIMGFNADQNTVQSSISQNRDRDKEEEEEDVDVNSLMNKDGNHINSVHENNDKNDKEKDKQKKQSEYVIIDDEKISPFTSPPPLMSNEEYNKVMNRNNFNAPNRAININKQNDVHFTNSNNKQQNQTSKMAFYYFWEDVHFVSVHCKLCGKHFIDLYSEYVEHLKNHFNNDPSKTWMICNECGCDKTKIWHSTTSFMVHLCSHGHENPFHCKFCKHTSSSKGNLVQHLKGKIHNIHLKSSKGQKEVDYR